MKRDIRNHPAICEGPTVRCGYLRTFRLDILVKSGGPQYWSWRELHKYILTNTFILGEVAFTKQCDIVEDT
jgi:hypothetical protein